jgi:hypothetical protein
LRRETAFAEEAGIRQAGHHNFFAALGDDRELHLAVLDVEDRVCHISL